jgi:hypothetical protein
MASRTDYPAPILWEFNRADRERFSRRFWRCPLRLVRSGLWAEWWREAGTSRGGGAIASLLPVLALHTWPETTTAADAQVKARDGAPAATEDDSVWTRWAYISHRRLARLSGMNIETVGASMRRLEMMGLLGRRRRPPQRHIGGPTTYEFRLATSLYPRSNRMKHGEERYAGIQGCMVYGGLWQLLPSASARNLLIVLACLDPILNADAMNEHLAECHHPDAESGDDGALTDLRRRHALSIADLVKYSGMTRSTVTDALNVVTTPIAIAADRSREPVRVVVHGPADEKAGRNGLRWFGVDHAAAREVDLNEEILNDPEQNAQLRSSIWPVVGRRRSAGREPVKPTPETAD